MKVTPIDHDYLEMLSDVVTPPRTKGLHFSDIYNAMYQELEPKRYKKGSKPDELRMQMGITLERILEDGFRKRFQEQTGYQIERPEEQSIQEKWMAVPLYFSPDLLCFNGSTRVGEIKLTWMASSEVPRQKGIDTFPSKFDKYFTQMKLYCRALELSQARLIACFINGRWDWKDKENGFRPELLAWDIEFTARELHEEWEDAMGFARTNKMFEKFDKAMNKRRM